MSLDKPSLTRVHAQRKDSCEIKKCLDQLRLIHYEERAFQRSHNLKVNQNLSLMEKIENEAVNHNIAFKDSDEMKMDESGYNLKMEQEVLMDLVDIMLKINYNILKGIKQLLLTNGEIDIEKVLCLHLLAIKQSENCTLRDDSPRHINVFTRYSNFLPNYIIESGESHIKCDCWSRNSTKLKCDSRPIKLHLTINKEIEKIINIVLITLKELNERKLKLLISMAHNINILRTILVRPSNQNYLTELLKSKLVLNSNHSETECCTLMKGTNEMIRDVNKYKKNMVFRVNPPSSLVYLRALLTDIYKFGSCPELKKRDSFCSLIDICKKISVGEDINMTGFSVLRNNSINSSGTAVISEDGNDITYIAGPSCKKSKRPDIFENNLTLLLKSTGFLDKKSEDKQKELKEESTMHAITPERTAKSLEEITKKQINKLKMKKKSVKKEPRDNEQLKASILRRLSNQQRISIAEEASKFKSQKIQVKEDSTPLAEIMSNVMSKRSLLNLARMSSQDEREYFLKPVKKGGLGLGEMIIGKENMSKMEQIAAIAQGETFITMITPLSEQSTPTPDSISSIDISTDSTWDLLKIKHDISQAEISKKFTRFVKSNTNPRPIVQEKKGKQKKAKSKPGSPTLTVVETRFLGRIPTKNKSGQNATKKPATPLET